MTAWSVVERALLCTAVPTVVLAAAVALGGRQRWALALVEAAAVLLAASVVALAVAVGPTDLLTDVPADALARLCGVMALVGVRGLLAAADDPSGRAVVARVAVPLVVPAAAGTVVGLWAWLGWRWSGPVPAGWVAAGVLVAGGAAAAAVSLRVRALAAADEDRLRAVAVALADRRAE